MEVGAGSETEDYLRLDPASSSVARHGGQGSTVTQRGNATRAEAEKTARA